MSLRTFRRALTVAAFAVAVGACTTSLASASTPSTASNGGALADSAAAVECRLAADVTLISVDNRVHATGTVTCSNPVYHIDVTVVLSRDRWIVARGENVCNRVATCVARTAAPHSPGLQKWCAEARGHYALSPSGPIIDLGIKRDCESG
jgi:hypothetical protein